MAYKLELPTDSKIHNLLHVSLLKPSHGNKPVSTTLPFADSDGHFIPQPLAILARRMKKQNNKSVTEVLVQWTETNPEDAVRRNLYKMQQKFPDFKWV